LNHSILPAAREDILAQFRYYLTDQQAPDIAARFLAAVETAVEMLLKMPQLGAPRRISNPSLAGLRSWPIRDFDQIRIYYLVDSDSIPLDPRHTRTIRVVRILHGKRDVGKLLRTTKVP